MVTTRSADDGKKRRMSQQMSGEGCEVSSTSEEDFATWMQHLDESLLSGGKVQTKLTKRQKHAEKKRRRETEATLDTDDDVTEAEEEKTID